MGAGDRRGAKINDGCAFRAGRRDGQRPSDKNGSIRPLVCRAFFQCKQEEAGLDSSMSSTCAKLIAAYESLPADEKQIVAKEILRRLPPLDSGPLDDEQVALAGDDMAAMLDEEENGSQAR